MILLSNKKHINVNGLRTVGKPNINGSLILNIDGIAAILAIDLLCTDLQNNSITITTAKYEINTNHVPSMNSKEPESCHKHIN